FKYSSLVHSNLNIVIPLIVHKVSSLSVFSYETHYASKCFQIFLNSATSVSLCANVVLLALLLVYRTSIAIGNYRVILVAFATLDIYISVFHLWYIPMFVLGEYGFVYYGHGCLSGKGMIARRNLRDHISPAVSAHWHALYVSLLLTHKVRVLSTISIPNYFPTKLVPLKDNSCEG
ncbi:hypothetical protein PRIPAC_82339, partial [Pristionchus pacificus]|uniref:Uncharacterized protein n=1 Tax=Pristionchus pacificus TaxID=54126 RepID=A0A2A6CPD5_PRIPA